MLAIRLSVARLGFGSLFDLCCVSRYKRIGSGKGFKVRKDYGLEGFAVGIVEIWGLGLGIV